MIQPNRNKFLKKRNACLFLILAILFLLGTKDLFAECPPSLSREFHDLRAHPPPDPWGKFYKQKGDVMDRLRRCLEEEKANEKKIIETMGPPDKTAKRGTSLFDTALGAVKFSETPRNIEKAKQALIYEWRGMHDFMFFITDGENLIISGWWMALDR